MKLKSTQKGYLLIEAMVAVSLLTMGFLGIFSLVSNSIGLNRVVSDQFIANYLAMEGIEVIKNLIDKNILSGSPWNQGFSQEKCYEINYKTVDIGSAAEVDCQTGSQNYLSELDGRYSYLSGVQTPFKRMIHIVPLSASEIKINSIINWKNRSGQFNINLEDHFFDWQP